MAVLLFTPCLGAVIYGDGMEMVGRGGGIAGVKKKVYQEFMTR